LLESTEATVHLSLPDVSVPAEETPIATEHPEWIVPMMSAGQRVGEMRVSKAAGLAEEDLEILAAVADISASAAMREYLHGQLVAAYDATIEGWSRALDLRDRETEGHSRRVTEVTLLLARSMGIAEADLTHIRRGALLHDIGKMGIPDAILLKPGELSPEEWTIMRRHPQHAYDLLWPVVFLRPALDIPLCHHERWDGNGYPRGLKGTAIPLGARIFAVVDVWDALRSDRPYRAAWSDGRVRAHLLGLAGSHLDAAVVGAFFRILDCGDVARAVARVPTSPAPVLPSDRQPVPHAGR
jgi:HD-GYP domain-containing protein (c-di-GMP phosphodiesterase class II)